MQNRLCLFLLTLCIGCGRVVMYDHEAGLDASPDAALSTDAAIAVDAAAPDATPVDPACDFAIDLRAMPTAVIGALPFQHGIVRARDIGTGDAAFLHLAGDGAGVESGAVEDYVDSSDELIVEWTSAVTNVHYTVTGGLDQNTSGTLEHQVWTRNFAGNATPASHEALLGDETWQNVAGSALPVTAVMFRGGYPDSIRIGSLSYSVCE